MKGVDRMTEKRYTVEGLSFEEYLRRNPMPAKTLDNDNYRVVEVRCKE